VNQTIQIEPSSSATVQRTAELFAEHQNGIYKRTDRMFAGLMLFQWLAGIAAAIWISPRTWIGTQSHIHFHVFAAVVIGGAITSLPVWLAWKKPGHTITRHVIAIGQMLTSALLIHLTGGRIETHFHIFGSLAFLAIYRDWRVLLTATVVVAADHFTRGVFWPQSVFGVLTASPWRWVEHAGWVLFENFFLTISILQSLKEMHLVSERQAKLEDLNARTDLIVTERTAELTKEIADRKRAGQTLKVEYAFNQILAKSPSWHQAMREALPAMCEIMNWNVGIFWATDCPAGVLRCGEIWSASNIEADDFKKLSRQMTFARGVGLPGRVWAGGQAAWIRDVGQDANFPRVVAAQQAGLRGAFAFPILFGDESIGVVEFFSREIRHPEQDLLQASINIGNQLSQFFERKRAEGELNYERSLLRALMDKTDDCIYFKDSTSRFIRSSASMAQRFGLQKAEDLVGKHDRDFFGDEHAREAYEDEQRIIRTGEPIIGKIEKEIRLDGHVTWVLTSKMPFRNVQDEVIGTFGISKDITAIKEAEEKLSQVHKQLLDTSRQAGMADVATSVLHNVGNVLNSINVSANMLSDQLKKSKSGNVGKVAALMREHSADLAVFMTNDAKGRQLPSFLAQLAEQLAKEQIFVLNELASLVKNVDHVKDIVAMQQCYAKVSGLTEMVRVTDLVEDALGMNASALLRHDVHFFREYAEHLPEINVDKHKVLQILVNLIRNAKQACDESDSKDKRLTMRVTNGGDKVLISLIDNGIGITAENLTRIFHHGFTTKKDGHGIGLHSGALAARELGGSLSVQSDGLRKGAVFTLELPCPAKLNAL
jgi:PAS domain S-box-containing protein